MASEDRLEMLDVLRACALAGMWLVHVQYYTSGEGESNQLLQLLIGQLGVWYALFALVFGASFGLQMERAQAAGRPFGWTLARRMVALGVLALAVEALTGYHVLGLYARAGLALLVFSRCGVRMLLVLAVVSLLAGPAVTAVEGAVRREWQGAAAAEQVATEARWAYRQAMRERAAVKASEGFVALTRLRARQALGAYLNPRTYIPSENMAFLFLGLAAAKRRLFQDPRGNRRTLAWVIGAGAPLGLLSLAYWELWWDRIDLGFKPFSLAVTDLIGVPLNGAWLAFAVAAGGALLFAGRGRFYRALAPFQGAGRMALTHYLVQLSLLELLLGGFLFKVEVPAWAGVLIAAGAFAVQVLASRWWLRRYRYGPVEWLWRLATHAKPQPSRLDAAGV